MKHLKLILSLVAALLFCSVPASAQKGAQALGASAGIGIKDCTWEVKPIVSLDLNYQYNFSKYYRIKPTLYGAIGDFHFFYNIEVDNNIFLISLRRLRPYFNLGLGVGNMCTAYSDEIGPNFKLGLGLDYRITLALALQTEVYCNLGNKYYPAFQLGIAYYFNMQ